MMESTGCALTELENSRIFNPTCILSMALHRISYLCHYIESENSVECTQTAVVCSVLCDFAVVLTDHFQY